MPMSSFAPGGCWIASEKSELSETSKKSVHSSEWTDFFVWNQAITQLYFSGVRVMAPLGQFSVQTVQPQHLLGSKETFLSSPMVKAWKLQT